MSTLSSAPWWKAAAADRGAGAEPAIEKLARSRPQPGHALPRPRHELPARPRGRAQAQGDLLHPRRGLRGGRDEARADRAHRRDMPVIVIAPYDRVFDKTVSNMEEVEARDGRIIPVTDPKGAEHATVETLSTLIPPEMAATVTPMVYAIPVQLLAYHTAVIADRRRPAAQPRQVGDRRVAAAKCVAVASVSTLTLAPMLPAA